MAAVRAPAVQDDPVIPEEDEQVTTALFAYWTSRRDAAAAQASRGTTDRGGRGGVTRGAHMDRVAQLLGTVAREAGAPAAAVCYRAPEGDPHRRKGSASRYTLPGWYRPTKEWDLVVYDPQERPCVAVELKSQNGPSFGNNANNRVEEAVGNAVDVAHAVEHGLIPGDPWLGYVYVLEDSLGSQTVVRRPESAAFSIDPVFAGWTYQRRVQVLVRRLVEDGHYDSAWAVTTSPPDDDGLGFDWAELDRTSGFGQFARSMSRHVRRHYPAGAPGPPL